MDIDAIIEALNDYATASDGMAKSLDSGAREGYQHHDRLKGIAQDRVDEIITAVIDERVADGVQDIVARLSAAGIELPSRGINY